MKLETENFKMSAGEAEPGKAKSAGIVSILIACIALSNLVCGFIYMALGGPDGSGVWCGFGVSYQQVLLHSLLIITTD